MEISVLSIGKTLVGEGVTVSGFSDGPSFSEFDAVVVDPIAVQNWFGARAERRRDGTLHTETWVDGGFGYSVRDTLRSRKAQTAKLLTNGGVLICVLRPVRDQLAIHYPRTPVAKTVHVYSWLPVAEIESFLVTGRGKANPDLVNSSHVFSQYFRAFPDQLEFEVALDGSKIDEASSNWIAKNKGGDYIGLEIRAGGGYILFLPYLAVDEAEKEAAVLINCVRTLQETAAVTPPPEWVSRYRLPGEDKNQPLINEVSAEIHKLEERKGALIEEQEAVRRFKKLLYERGKYQLEPVVRAAFRLLGCQVLEPDECEKEYEKKCDAILHLPEGSRAIVEIEGKNADAIHVEKYRQLLDYMDLAITADGDHKGILVGNGFRLLDPEERPPKEQFTDDVKKRAGRKGYCLLTTCELFRAVRITLERPDDEQLKKNIRNGIIGCEGVYQFTEPQKSLDNLPSF